METSNEIKVIKAPKPLRPLPNPRPKGASSKVVEPAAEPLFSLIRSRQTIVDLTYDGYADDLIGPGLPWEHPSWTRQELVCCNGYRRFPVGPGLRDPLKASGFFAKVMFLKSLHYIVAGGALNLSEFLLRRLTYFPNGTKVFINSLLFLFFVGYIRQIVVRMLNVGRHYPSNIIVYMLQMLNFVLGAVIVGLHTEDNDIEPYVFFMNVYATMTITYLFTALIALLPKTKKRCFEVCKLERSCVCFWAIFIGFVTTMGFQFLLDEISRLGALSSFHHFMAGFVCPLMYSLFTAMFEIHETMKMVAGKKFPLGDKQHLYVANCF